MTPSGPLGSIVSVIFCGLRGAQKRCSGAGELRPRTESIRAPRYSEIASTGRRSIEIGRFRYSLALLDCRNPDDQQDLEASQWAHENQGLLLRCFEQFQSAGSWPTLNELQQGFDLDGQEADVAGLAGSMPSLLGVVDHQRLELSVRGMSEIPAALSLLEIWVAILKFACERMTRDAHDRYITFGDVLAACDNDSRQAMCVVMIFLRESWPPQCGQGVGKFGWWIAVTDAVLEVRTAGTVSDVLKIRGPIQSSPRPSPAEQLAALADALGERQSGLRP